MDFAKPEHITAGEYYDESAVKISNLIDEELRKESVRRKDASRREIKVMLLGQAESGKYHAFSVCFRPRSLLVLVRKIHAPKAISALLCLPNS